MVVVFIPTTFNDTNPPSLLFFDRKAGKKGAKPSSDKNLC